MEKKQNDKLELSLDQMDKISGGVTGEEPSDQGEEEENGNTVFQNYIPGKRDPH